MAGKVRLIVTSTFGLEAIVRREVEDLGLGPVVVADGKVEFDAEMKDIPRLNVWLRTADRVLVKVGEFEASDFGRLFDQAKALPWEDWLPHDAKLTVIGKCVRSKLMSVRSCQSIVHKALVERLKEKLHVTELPETGPEFTVQVAILKDVAQLTIDTSGPGLNKRGYRVGVGEAPLRENLAAALVLLSFWNKDRLLVDPMCGAGTILIEAAMMARNIAPNVNREFSSEQWPCVDPAYWRAAREDAQRAVRPSGSLKIQGYDIDLDRILDAKANARKAGVDKDITFEQKDIKNFQVADPFGIVISNPPYGIKIGKAEDLGPIYAALHQAFKDQKGWSVYILTADKAFPDHFKRSRPDKVRKLFNGTIEVNYYQYYGARPKSSESA